MPLPPGSGNFPPSEPPSVRRYYYVTNIAPNGTRQVLGPFLGAHVSLKNSIQVMNMGVMVTANECIRLPLTSGVRSRSVVRDVATGQTWTCMDSNTWATHIEAFVTRNQADQ